MSDDGQEVATIREGPARSGRTTDPPKLATTAFDPAGERFDLGDELGRGGMGRVVAATDRALARDVAIKQALSDDDTDLARFEREVRITARLEHPSIVPVHDAGRDRNGRPYYVMRRLRGQPLADRVEAATTTKQRVALVPYVLAAVDAAAFAHARNIIHRDIKPWNILVGEYGETVLIDWGLARELSEPDQPMTPTGPPSGSNLTQVGHVVGTPGFMAPEQERGEPADPRADVYALGATLRFAIGASDEIPEELLAIVRKAMAPDKAGRYRDAGELAADRRAVLAGKRVAAHRYPRRERLLRFVRAHRVAIATIAIATIAAIVFGTIALVNVIDERDRADAARVEAEHQRERADERAETLILDRASMLTRTDPTRSVALLRKIPAESPRLRRARDIAAAAVLNGVARGVQTPIDSITLLRFTPDGRSIVAAGRTGDIVVIDRVTGAMRTWPSAGDSPTQAIFVGDELWIAPRPGLVRIDLRTGDHHTLVTDVEIEKLWRVGERIRYFDSRHKRVVERSTRDDDPGVALATGVTTAVPIGDRVIVGDRKSLRLIGGPREIVLSTRPELADSVVIAVSRDQQKLAVGGDEIREWAIDGTELGVWHERPIAMFYGPAGLYSQTPRGELKICVPGRAPIELQHVDLLPWAVQTDDGVIALAQGGSIVMIDQLGFHVLPQEFPNSRTLAVDETTSTVVIGSLRGVVRWIDLRPLTPPIYPHTDGHSPCWVDRDRAYVVGARGIEIVDRRSGRVTTARIKVPVIGCIGGIGRRLFAVGPNRTLIVDTLTGAVLRTVPGGGFIDLDANRFIYIRDGRLLEIDPDTDEERVLYDDANVTAATSNGRWALAQVGPLLVRIDRETGNRLGLVANTELAAVTTQGTVYYARDHALWAYVDGRHERRSDLPRGEIRTVHVFEEAVGLRYADGSLWVVDGDRLINRGEPTLETFAGFGSGDVATRVVPYQRVIRYHLRTGESEVRHTGVFTASRGAGDLLLGMTSTNLAVLETTVPDDPARLATWIDTVTNARVDDTGALVWNPTR